MTRSLERVYLPLDWCSLCVLQRVHVSVFRIGFITPGLGVFA